MFQIHIHIIQTFVSDHHSLSVVRGPDTTHTGLGAGDSPVGLLQLLSTGVAEELGLLQDLVGRHVSHADGLSTAVDVVANDHGVLAGSRGDGEFDLGVGGGELGEEGLDEAAVARLDQIQIEECMKVWLTSFPWSYRPSRSRRSPTSCTEERMRRGHSGSGQRQSKIRDCDQLKTHLAFCYLP